MHEPSVGVAQRLALLDQPGDGVPGDGVEVLGPTGPDEAAEPGIHEHQAPELHDERLGLDEREEVVGGHIQRGRDAREVQALEVVGHRLAARGQGAGMAQQRAIGTQARQQGDRLRQELVVEGRARLERRFAAEMRDAQMQRPIGFAERQPEDDALAGAPFCDQDPRRHGRTGGRRDDQPRWDRKGEPGRAELDAMGMSIRRSRRGRRPPPE